jgi:hypothetical protein
VGVAVPLATVAAVPIMVEPSNSSTCPVGVPPVTDTLNEKGVPEATFAPGTVNFVTVVVGGGGGGGDALPPPHPSVKLSMQTRPRPSAARYRLRPPGRKSRNSAAKPVPALSVHHPLSPLEGGVDFASNIRSGEALEAVRVVDVASTEQLNCPVTADAPVTLMFSGDGVHVTPGVDVDAVTPTVPVNPPLGVTVTVEFTLAPVVDDKVRLAGA